MTWDVSTDSVEVEIDMATETPMAADWGEIGGTLSDQTDLQTALNAKQDTIPANTYDPYGAAASAVSTHNSANDAHSAKFAAKQDAIADLSTIRSGAAAGATAYQKPASGIPKADMANDVQTSLGKADTAIQQHQDLAPYRTSAEQDVIDAGKQSTISDLAAIRSGASLGSTALQAVPNTYRTAAAQDAIHDATKQDALPEAVNDRYLHSNASTGALEWAQVEAGGGIPTFAINASGHLIVTSDSQIEANKFSVNAAGHLIYTN